MPDSQVCWFIPSAAGRLELKEEYTAHFKMFQGLRHMLPCPKELFGCCGSRAVSYMYVAHSDYSHPTLTPTPFLPTNPSVCFL